MKKNIPLPEVEPVELKSCFGLRPGVIIIIVTVLVLLLAFFCLFMLPGIVHGGRKVAFTSDVTNVGVFMDGRYLMSTTDGRVFVPSGEHEFEYVKSGVRFGKTTVRIDHPIFFTLFRTAKKDIDVEVPKEKEIIDATVELFRNDLTAASRITKYDAVTVYKPIFRDFAKDVKALGIRLGDDFWTDAIAMISTEEMKNDWNELKTILGSSPVDDSVLSRVEFGRHTDDYSLINEVTEAAKVERGYAYYDGGSVTLGEYSGNAWPQTNEKNIKVNVEPFAIAMDAVTEYEYARFIAENPEWGLDNKAGLIAEGLVDEGYLDGVTVRTDFVSNRPVVNISWHAANAYAEWMSEKTGETLRLPTEAEWIFAANSVQDKKKATTINHKDTDGERPHNMMGMVWEYTDTAYLPLSRMMDYEELTKNVNEDVVIKGGSYLMRPDSYDQYSVGVTTTDHSSDSLGFRLVKEI